jgi:hypothetical protein
MTAVTAHGIARPPLSVTVQLDDGQEKTIKLTYGMHQDLQRLVPDPASLLETIMSDPYTRDYVIRRCLTPLKKIVTKPEEELVPAEEIEISDPDQIDKILQWAAGHLLYFFATSAGGLKQLGEAFKAAFGNIPTEDQPAPSTTGSES